MSGKGENEINWRLGDESDTFRQARFSATNYASNISFFRNGDNPNTKARILRRQGTRYVCKRGNVAITNREAFWQSRFNHQL
jgi:hypothetical protein